MQILTGTLPADTHPLRSGLGGDDPPVTRAGDWVCMRAPLQTSTPSARRLHYWHGRGGRIELSRIVTHDDYTP